VKACFVASHIGHTACCCAPWLPRKLHLVDNCPEEPPVSQRKQQIEALEQDWKDSPRWKGVKRGYSAAEVVKLRGSLVVEHTLAKRGAEKLWRLMHERPFVNSLGALTGNQAMQQVRAGVPAIYLSGWQVAADA